MKVRVTLNEEEIAVLDLQDPTTAKDGGFQGLLVKLQKKVNRDTGELDLDEEDLRRLSQYAFGYKKGGWENRLKAIFGRVLGPELAPPSADSPGAN